MELDEDDELDFIIAKCAIPVRSNLIQRISDVVVMIIEPEDTEESHIRSAT